MSTATQLSQNQNIIFCGKVIFYILIRESFGLPSVYKECLQTKAQALSIKAKSDFKFSPTLMCLPKQHCVDGDTAITESKQNVMWKGNCPYFNSFNFCFAFSGAILKM